MTKVFATRSRYGPAITSMVHSLGPVTQPSNPRWTFHVVADQAGLPLSRAHDSSAHLLRSRWDLSSNP